MKDDFTTKSHYLIYTFLFRKVGRMYFLNLGVKGSTLSLSSSKSILSQPFRSKSVSEVVRIGSIIIIHLSELWVISGEAADEIQSRSLLAVNGLMASVYSIAINVCHCFVLYIALYWCSHFMADVSLCTKQSMSTCISSWHGHVSLSWFCS